VANLTAENYVNYQERAAEFAVDDMVVPYGQYDTIAGRVTAVWPAIGMVDVEFSSGNKRYAVEDLQRLDAANTVTEPPDTNSVPGGQPTVSVPGGPEAPLPDELRETAQVADEANKKASTRRVAEAFVKKALYWHSNDRKYRATRGETGCGKFGCPKCRAKGIESVLKPAVYKRRGGQSERLLGCPGCLFLIKQLDIENLSIGAPAEVEFEGDGG